MANIPKHWNHLKSSPSKDGGSHAFRTLLGWYIVGLTGETASSTAVSCNRMSVQDMASKTAASHYFAMETNVKDAS